MAVGATAHAKVGQEAGTESNLGHALEELARGCRILEINGHGDRIFGHLAMRDPEGRGFWLKRAGIALGEVCEASDFLLLDFDGHVLSGDGEQHIEWPIHAEILKRRPDLNYTAHTHPFYGVIYSTIADPLPALRVRSFGVPRRYEGSSEFIVTPERGAELACALDDGMVVFMRHHGVVFCGNTLVALVNNGIGIEDACHQVLVATASGLPWTVPDEEERVRKSGSTRARPAIEPVWSYYCRVLARAEAAGDPRLATMAERG